MDETRREFAAAAHETRVKGILYREVILACSAGRIQFTIHIWEMRKDACAKSENIWYFCKTTKIGLLGNATDIESRGRILYE